MAKGYAVTKTYIPAGDYHMNVLILKPTVSKQPQEKMPGLLWIHSGTVHADIH